MPEIKNSPNIIFSKDLFLLKDYNSLSESDLLTLVLKSRIKGSQIQNLAQQVIKLFSENYLDVTIKDLQIINGIGPVKASQISSAIILLKNHYENKNSTDFVFKNLEMKIHKPRKQAKNLINKVHLGDCLKVMKNIPSKSIDMILCDLPYGTTQNKWDSVIPLDKLWEQYERIIKDNGAIVLTSQGVFTAKLILSNEKLFKYKIVWEKSKSTNFLNAKKQPLRKHEDICVFYKTQPIYNPQMRKGKPYNKGIRKDQLTGSYGDFKPVEVKSDGERYPIDIVYFKTAESEGSVYHPTQKPVALGQYLIRTYTKPGDIVLDNTCGSGSFLVSAVLEGRNFIGIEKNDDVHLFKNKKIDYIKVCKDRINEAQNN